MDIGPGDLVECVDNSTDPGCVWSIGCEPILGRVYTVRETGSTFYGGPGVRLIELRLSAHDSCRSFYDDFYRVSRFRPIPKEQRELIRSLADRETVGA